eukprot:g1936.t1
MRRGNSHDPRMVAAAAVALADYDASATTKTALDSAFATEHGSALSAASHHENQASLPLRVKKLFGAGIGGAGFAAPVDAASASAASDEGDWGQLQTVSGATGIALRRELTEALRREREQKQHSAKTESGKGDEGEGTNWWSSSE